MSILDVATQEHRLLGTISAEQARRIGAADLRAREREHDAMGEAASANDRQVAGDHYRRAGMQHWDLMVAAKADYLGGQITRYVERHPRKNGREDLEKAVHYAEKRVEVCGVRRGATVAYMTPIADPLLVSEYCAEAGHDAWQQAIFIGALCSADHQRTAALIRRYLREQYPPEERSQDTAEPPAPKPEHQQGFVDRLAALPHLGRFWSELAATLGLSRNTVKSAAFAVAYDDGLLERTESIAPTSDGPRKTLVGSGRIEIEGREHAIKLEKVEMSFAIPDGNVTGLKSEELIRSSSLADQLSPGTDVHYIGADAMFRGCDGIVVESDQNNNAYRCVRWRQVDYPKVGAQYHRHLIGALTPARPPLAEGAAGAA